MQTIKKIFFFLNKTERKQLGLLVFMMLIMALLDLIGVASILPFMAVLTNPSLIDTNFILQNFYQFSKIFGVENNSEFLFFLGLCVLVLLVLSLAFKALTSYAQVRFVYMREYTIGKRLIEGHLHQPYSWFIGHHSADLGKTILSEVGLVVGNGILPFMDLIARSMVAVALISLLVITDPKLAIIVGITLLLAYMSIFNFVRNYLKLIGNKRLKSNQLRFLTVNEVFSAAKEVKIGGLEKFYINKFSSSAQIFARTQTSASLIASLPRYIFESIAFGGVMLLILYLMRQTGSFNNALPIISLYVFAGYRLMPAVQQIYSSFTLLTFTKPSIDKIYEDLKSLKSLKLNDNFENLSLKKNINLKNIYYNYPNSPRTLLDNISLSIPAKSIVGIIGSTGSGKTTIVDIILGLLKPNGGSLEVDGQIITDRNLRAWQRSIGYVPQNIYLSDETISSNIAFGVEPKNINQEAVVSASQIANLHDFVFNELKDRYQTTIGERGVKLSGGQRQRIGIARALYHNPQVLVLDEATSALDNETEKAIMDAVNILKKKMTIILIAHRLNTVKSCDVIFKIENGKLLEQGSFSDMLSPNITL